MKKYLKTKTKTGALPNSAGFPGSNMVKKKVVLRDYDGEEALFTLVRDETILANENAAIDDHRYWE